MEKKSVEKKTIVKEIIKEKAPDEKVIVKEITKVKAPKKQPAKVNISNPPQKNEEVENILIENFVSLQRVMSNLSVKFDDLTTQISKLLALFEISAKALAEKDFDMEKNNKENAKILEKIENVLEQNKTIARGLTLMHDKINEPPNYPQYQQQAPPMQRMMPPQNPQQFKPVQKASLGGGVSEEFHRPISSNE